MKFASVILALSAVAVMVQAAIPSTVPETSDVVDGVARGRNIHVPIAKKRALSEGTSNVMPYVPADPVAVAEDQQAKVQVSKRAVTADVAADVQAILDFIAKVVADISVKLNVDVYALVLAHIRANLDVAGLVAIDADVQAAVDVAIKAIIDLDVKLDLEIALQALVAANINDNEIDIDVVVAGVHALIEARVNQVVATIDVQILAEVYADIKVADAIEIPVNVYADVSVGIDIKAEVNKVLANLDNTLTALTNALLAIN
ncbi:hypothetical protein BGZ65_010297 [Modicella reniformis]|uniref:Uncharacterized protein n=1 Tax=Modicella reniformis TaxID=1440133 RepID=A0A9P6IKC9_9FUNG|nr:hypothetical protein BGZ65_010297 [Modicella reniformis]